MSISLRTRLFLTVAVVLAASIAASSLLSRRATLVEVREIVTQAPHPSGELADVKPRVEQALASGADVNDVLARAAGEIARPLLLVSPDNKVVAASRPDLRAARVTEATAEGGLTLDVSKDGALTALVVRGPRPVAVTAPDGRPAGRLYALPAADGERAAQGRLLAPWLLTTLAVAAIALVLTFALSRRILRPVGELTEAAGRLQHGELGVQVTAAGDDEIGALGRAFNAMAAELAETERLRRQMVSDVAHELRSPVTNLRCTLEAIQDGLTPADRAGIDALHEETLFLQRLIDDLQDLALAEAGRLLLHVDEVNVEDVIRRAASSLSKTPGAAIGIDIDASVARASIDGDRIEQVLRNLLSNARRHTPADGRITVSATRDDARLRIAVRDTGGGIAAEHLPHVFDRFYRADQSRARATGGAGLGLAIAQQLVAAHGGTLTASSEGSGHGALFVIELPLSRR